MAKIMGKNSKKIHVHETSKLEHRNR